MPLWKQRLFERLMAPAGEANSGGSDDPPENLGEVDPPTDKKEDKSTDKPDEETVITIGDQEPTEEEDHAAPDWVREVRKTNRELARENKELKAKLQAPAEDKALQLGKKPSMQDDDIDYDEDKYSAKLEQWHETKRQIDAKASKAREEQEAQTKAWQLKLEGYGKGKADLRVTDFEDAEGVAQEKLTVTQQGIVLQAAENSAMFVYAIGKSKEHAEKLAAITDPVKFAWEAGKLEGSMKQQTRTKSPPPPARLAQGDAKISGANDSTLDNLRSEAAKTGDYSKVLAYKNKKRA
jgi:hypothetical protein